MQQVEESVNSPHENVLLFDGVCNLCNGFIDYLIKRDTKKTLFYCPLQSPSAQKVLPSHLSHLTKEPLNSVVFKKGEAVYVESTAALLAVSQLGGKYKLILIFIIIPAFIRDFIYKWVANNRYTLFGKKDTCRIPSPDEASRFL